MLHQENHTLKPLSLILVIGFPLKRCFLQLCYIWDKFLSYHIWIHEYPSSSYDMKSNTGGGIVNWDHFRRCVCNNLGFLHWHRPISADSVNLLDCLVLVQFRSHHSKKFFSQPFFFLSCRFVDFVDFLWRGNRKRFFLKVLEWPCILVRLFAS